MDFNISLFSLDTCRIAAEKQFEVLRGMNLAARAEMTFQLSNNLRSVVESGISKRHPDYTPETVKQAVLRLIIDKELFDKIFPASEVTP